VLVRVQPGEPTRVTQWQVQTEGELARLAAAGDAQARALQQRLAGLGEQQPGQIFRNADWAGAKQQLLARLRSAGYAAATLHSSAADIDASTHSAQLRVTLDSGPLYRAGPVLVRGLVHHDETMVQNLAGFAAGAPLTEDHLVAYQDRLQKTRLFQSVQVRFDPELADTAHTPVLVQLVELPLQQATVGVGISANTGPRTTLEHTHRRPFDWPAVAYNKLEWGRATQSWTGDLQSHPGRDFYRNLLGVQIERVVSDTDVVLSQRLRLGRTQDTPRIERLYFLELLRSRQDDLPTTANGPTTAMALSANLHWVWRDLDSVLLPTRGLTLALQTGAGQAGQLGGQQGPFGRFYGRLTGYLPLGQRWYGQARLEAGQVVHRDGVAVPDALGFRAGGDDSVRGYAYRSLAPLDTGGGTVSGQSLLTASVEVARPILDSLPSVWGAVFVDAGRAVSHWRDYSPAIGWGAGIRWRSPIGPLRIDLARAQELQRWRLHLSVGIAF
jgi:translocation and assembly module TamA